MADMIIAHKISRGCSVFSILLCCWARVQQVGSDKWECEQGQSFTSDPRFLWVRVLFLASLPLSWQTKMLLLLLKLKVLRFHLTVSQQVSLPKFTHTKHKPNTHHTHTCHTHSFTAHTYTTHTDLHHTYIPTHDTPTSTIEDNRPLHQEHKLLIITLRAVITPASFTSVFWGNTMSTCACSGCIKNTDPRGLCVSIKLQVTSLSSPMESSISGAWEKESPASLPLKSGGEPRARVPQQAVC